MSSNEDKKESPLPVALPVKSALPTQLAELKNEMLKLVKQKMEMEREGHGERVVLEQRLRTLEDKVTSLSTGFLVDLGKLKEDISEIKRGMGSADHLTSAVRANKDKLLQLEGNREFLMDILEKKDRTIQAQLQELKTQIEKKLPKSSGTIESEEKMTCFALNNANGARFKADFEWRVVNRAVESEWFKWREYPVVGQLKISQNYHGRPCLSLRAEFQDPNKLFRDLKPFPNVYYLLRNAKTEEALCANAFHSFGDHHLSYDHTLADRYQLNDGVIEVYVEPPAMARTAHSYDGTLIWTISDYSERKRMEREGFIEYQESPYFYTGPKGYRVQLRVYLDGVGKQKRAGLTARVSFLTGAFDEDLSHEFAHRTTVTLVNEHDPEFNVSQSVEKDLAEEKSYSMDLCDVKETLFALHDDALTLKVLVEAI